MSIFYKDPGANNEFPKDDMGKFDSVSYLKDLSDELLSIDESLIIEASKILSQAILNKNQIFFCGNGGSFAIANIWYVIMQRECKDFTKRGYLHLIGFKQTSQFCSY